MSEQVRGHESLKAAVETTSYEDLRDSASGDAALAWRQADREAERLRQTYQELREDPRYAESYKQERAWAVYEASKASIEEKRAKAKETLAKQAVSARRLSVPVPDGESLITGDTQKILASQNEAARIIRQLERAKDTNKGPFTPDRTQILRGEYARGLEIGGTLGGCLVRGVEAAAREVGIDLDVVVDPYRKDRHRDSLARAEHAERLTSIIGKSVPAPPFSEPGGGAKKAGFLREARPRELEKQEKPTTIAGLGKGKRRAWK